MSYESSVSYYQIINQHTNRAITIVKMIHNELYLGIVKDDSRNILSKKWAIFKE